MKMGIVLALPWAAACTAQSVECSSPIQQDLVACLSQRYDQADGQLNADYQALLAELDSNQSDQLRRTQRRWIEFRDEACELAYEDVSPGREAPIDRLVCLEEKSLLRTHLLKTAAPVVDAEHLLAELGIEAEALVAGLRASSRETVAPWLRYMEAHCSEDRISDKYESDALCIVHHRLVDK